MTRHEIEDATWNICMRVGSINVEVYKIKHGTIKEPMSLPSKLVILINKYFNDTSEMALFFSPTNKHKNFKQFAEMLNSIAPFRANEILFSGAMFSMPDRDIFVRTTEYIN